MRRRYARTFLILAALLASSFVYYGCATPIANSPAPTLRSGPDRDVITLVAKNFNWSDAVVYVLHPTPRRRVLDLTTNSRKRVRIPRSPDDTYVFGLQLIGSKDSWVSPRYYVSPGGEIELAIHNQLPQTNATPRAE